MDLFTRSVDASLQTSRSYDDPLHIYNPDAASLSRTPFEITPSVPAVSLIIVSLTPISTSSILSIQTSSTAKSHLISSSDERIDLSVLSSPFPSTLFLSPRVSDDRATALATALLSIPSQLILVLTSHARFGPWARMNGVRTLATSAFPDLEEKRVEEPAILGGVEAAILAEAEMDGRKAVCVVGEEGGVEEVRDLQKVWMRIWNGMSKERIEVEEVSGKRIRECLGRNDKMESIYM